MICSVEEYEDDREAKTHVVTLTRDSRVEWRNVTLTQNQYDKIDAIIRDALRTK